MSEIDVKEGGKRVREGNKARARKSGEAKWRETKGKREKARGKD